MHDGQITRVRVEVDVETAAERALSAWLRSWRRRGVHLEGKWLYPLQGAVRAAVFRAPAAAVADLRQRLADVGSGVVVETPDEM